MTQKLPTDAPAKIRAMYDSGITIADIHRVYSHVSRQRIEQIAKRLKTYTPAPKKPCATSDAIVAYVATNGRCTKGQIAKALGLYNARTGRLVDKLIEAGLLAHVPYSEKVQLA